MPILPLNVPEASDVDYAAGRLTTRTYVSSSFSWQFGQDRGERGRYVRRVFDEVVTEDDDEWEWRSEVVYTTPGGRKQIELQVARSAGVIRKIRIQKVPTSSDATKLEPVLELDREQSARLIDMLRALDSIPIEGENTVRIDDDLLRQVFEDPTAIAAAYAANTDRFRALIESDATASDVIALQSRRGVVATMRLWLEDEAAFNAARDEAGGPEKAWQQLLEANPWVLGVGLSGQLLTSWDKERLEQTVVGRSIKGVGKRVDALLRTAGIVRSMVFAEIKHHRTELLADEYRTGCWRPSSEVSGAVVQIQQTVHLAVRDLGTDFMQEQAPDGSLLSGGTFLLQPRSFVVVGCLNQLAGDGGGAIPDKVRSFELFRRNLHEPEILTFDEILARAEWQVEVASREVVNDGMDPLVDVNPLTGEMTP
ncbi:Shedu immune nuclease family protein [Allobranchiibius sp. GilTou73]|uniref:Shedu immune nuclease family protein n=1 Tax=Allobranchiibius sp. GilTou73 TaxID=2904523 RepID=UPI001F168810|nr:Shedu immune nuclease family protein [Allobranchiibius sp. GilTou73]UIJ35319.1 DUF4263 domain-containing protein [Allobranchiibius sp. GilTou73]